MLDLLHCVRYPFTPEALAFAPESPGVYVLFDKGEPIYVGSTATEPGRTLRRCIAAHFDGPHGSCTTHPTPTHYAWEISLSSEAQAKRILEHHKAQHGRLPRCNAE